MDREIEVTPGLGQNYEWLREGIVERVNAVNPVRSLSSSINLRLDPRG